MISKLLTILLIFLFNFSSLQSQEWIQLGKDIEGEAKNDFFGISVSVNSGGTIIACGADGNDENGKNSGKVKIFKYTNGTWMQLGNDIYGEKKRKGFGNSVSLSADGLTVAVGTIWNNNNGNDSGNVRIFKYLDGNWKQIGNDIVGKANGDLCGASVSLSSDGSIIAVSSPGNDDNGKNSGHVRIYKNINDVWSQIGKDINGENSHDRSEYLSLSSDGKILAIGSPNNDNNGSNAGHVRIYKNNSGTWSQIGNDINGERPNDWSGRSVVLNSDGSIVAIGSIWKDGNGKNSGCVRIFQNINNSWILIGGNIDGESAGDMFGISISLDKNGSIIAIGAISNDGNGTEGGHVRVFQYKK